MSLIADYILYNKGNECPEQFHIWSCLVAIATVVGRKTSLQLSGTDGADSYIEIGTNLYVCLVGKQGLKKSSAMRIAKHIIKEVNPRLPMSSSVMSREQIVKFLAGDEQMRAFETDKGVLEEYRPFAMFINEFNNFISFNPVGMIQFLTDIYDEKVFDSSTIARGVESIVNPCVNIIACVVPDWLRQELKSSVISGGFCRRMIFVHVTDPTVRIPFPTISPESMAAKERVVKRLLELHTAKLPKHFTWTPEARKFYAEWYMHPKTSDDPIMSGFLETKGIQVLKVAMLISLSESNDCVLRAEHIQLSLAMFETIEGNMEKLSSGVGTSKLAYPTSKLIEDIEHLGGWIDEKKARLIMRRALEPREIDAVIAELKRTGEIIEADFTPPGGVTRRILCTPAQFEKFQKGQKPQ
jgi:hypothetical protein